MYSIPKDVVEFHKWNAGRMRQDAYRAMFASVARFVLAIQKATAARMQIASRTHSNPA